MVWRVPKSGVTHEPVSKIEEQFESLMRSKQASTYQADYIQTPFEELRRAGKSTREASEAQSVNNGSTMKGDYRKPPSSVVPELLVPTTRYGANVNKSQPATGAVPNVTTGVYMSPQPITSYDRDFNGGNSVRTACNCR